MKRFWGYLNNAFTGTAATVVVFLLQFCWWMTTPNHQVPIWTLYGVVVLSFLVIAFGYAAARYFIHCGMTEDRIKVFQCEVVAERVIIIAQSSPALSYGMMVSVYKRDPGSGVELRLATAYVENTPQAETVQLAGLDYDPSFKTSVAKRKITPGELFIVPRVDRECWNA